MIRQTFLTSWGAAGLTWNETGLVGFELPGFAPQHSGANSGADEDVDAIPDWIAAVINRVQAHFIGRLQDFRDVVLDWSRVSDFQQAVYRHTQAVKPGHTISYGEIARRMALPPAGARAVGVALASNPWPLLVPCHRVIAADGKMTGFSGPGGVRTKTRLLALEGAELLSE